ncbi:MAG: hypothetical protein R3B56_12675 [Candidatus Scalinduaceae bacterium]
MPFESSRLQEKIEAGPLDMPEEIEGVSLETLFLEELSTVNE